MDEQSTQEQQMQDAEEIWAPAPGLEKYAEVSTFGRLRSKVRPHPRGGVRGGKYLTLHPSIHGYLFSCVHAGGIKKNLYVHRAVAQAFLPNHESLPQVNHKDGNKANNLISNLEWCTASYNSKHKYDVIGYKMSNRKAIIGTNGESVLTYDSLCDAGRDGFNVYNISAVIHGRRKSAGGYSWRVA